nr:chromate transporter [Maliibacterium massiliense]
MIYLELFWVFTQIGFCSFGGQSMIPFINEEMLAHGWMTLTEVSDIVAIAEMTPGSLGVNAATFAGMRTAGLLGAMSATLGAMMPSLTLCIVAAIFMRRLKDNPYLDNAMYGIRPVCIGLMVASCYSLSLTNYVTAAGTFYLQPVLIGVLIMFLLVKFKLTIPKTIGIAALLGLIFC